MLFYAKLFFRVFLCLRLSRIKSLDVLLSSFFMFLVDMISVGLNFRWLLFFIMVLSVSSAVSFGLASIIIVLIHHRRVIKLRLFVLSLLLCLLDNRLSVDFLIVP